MRLWKPLTDQVQACDWFNRLGPHERIVTSNSLSFRNNFFAWTFSDEPFYRKYLGLLSHVRSEIKRNLDKLDVWKISIVKRQFGFNPDLIVGNSGQFLNAWELDLSQAYVTAATLLGLISSDTRSKLQSIPKRWRLRILGAIASRKTILEVTPPNIIRVKEVKEDKGLRRAWFTICGLVDLSIRQAAAVADDKYLFYWYDNLICTEQVDLSEVLTEFRWQAKNCQVHWFRTTAWVSFLVYSLGQFKPRPFYLPFDSLDRIGKRSILR